MFEVLILKVKNPMKELKQLTILLTLTTLAYLQACQREGCGRTVKSKDRISEESKAKMAYTGTETLVFLEIDNGDSTELVFKPSEHYDTMQTSYSYYEAPNGDECIGYETSTEVLYREYYCEERSWKFVCGISAITEQLALRFDEIPKKSLDKYNFKVFIDAPYLNDTNRNGYRAIFYLGEYLGLNGLNSDVCRVNVSFPDEYLYYDLSNGFIKWEFEEINYSLILKELIRN
jgi:hypothetical protein